MWRSEFPRHHLLFCLLWPKQSHTHTHTETQSQPSMVVHATVTPSGLALAALYSAIKKAIILFKGIYHFRGGRGVSTLGFSKRGRVQSIRSIPQVSLAFHQTGKSRSGLSFLAGNVNQCVCERKRPVELACNESTSHAHIKTHRDVNDISCQGSYAVEWLCHNQERP